MMEMISSIGTEAKTRKDFSSEVPHLDCGSRQELPEIRNRRKIRNRRNLHGGRGKTCTMSLVKLQNAWLVRGRWVGR